VNARPRRVIECGFDCFFFFFFFNITVLNPNLAKLAWYGWWEWRDTGVSLIGMTRFSLDPDMSPSV
jgi:hypothetical protein